MTVLSKRAFLVSSTAIVAAGAVPRCTESDANRDYVRRVEKLLAQIWKTNPNGITQVF